MRPAPTRRRQASLAALVIAALAIAACDSEPESETRPSILADWSAGVAEQAATAAPSATGQAPPTGAVPTPTGGGAPPPGTAPESTTTTAGAPGALPQVAFDIDVGPGGFAGSQGLTGGLGDEVYVVTTTGDSGAGSYREAVSGGDRIVRFDPSLDGQTIHLKSPVETDASNLTIDGSGLWITVSGRATRFSGTNIVVAGMHFKDNDDEDEDDALTFRGPHDTQVFGLFGNVFDHAADGLVDIIWNEGHDVYATICGNSFQHHDKAMLIDSGEDDTEGGRYHVTLCRNHWLDIYQRAPFSRHADVHDYNSVFERYGEPDGEGGGSKSGGDGDGASQHLLENNMAFPRAEGEKTFDGSQVSDPRTEWAAPHLHSDGALRISGSLLATVDGVTATEHEHDADAVFTPPYPYELHEASATLAGVIAATAGVCLPSGRNDAVVPCAPLIVDDADGRLDLVVTPAADGSATASIERVEFMVGDITVPGQRLDSDRWSIDVSDLGIGPTPVRAVATTSDGRSVKSDLVLVARTST